MGKRLWITDPLLRCAIENWSKVLLWSCSPCEAHSAIHMSFPGFLQVIPNVYLWELKQPDSLSHSLAVSVSPHSLFLWARINTHTHTHTHTHKQCLSKVQRPWTCAAAKQNVLPVEFKICGGWINGFYFLPAMKLSFALKLCKLFNSLENSLLCHSQHHSFYVKRHLLQSRHIVICFLMFLLLFYFTDQSPF